MFEAYKVAVELAVIDKFSNGIFLASAAFDKLNFKIEKLDGLLGKIQKYSLPVGGILGGIGLGIAAPLIDAVSKAAELQKQMIGIQIATHGTTAQMDSLRIAMEKASSSTIFNTVDVAKMAKIIATSNNFSASELTSILPVIAKFADVNAMMKGTPYSSSVIAGVKLMHLAQKYDPAEVSPYFNTLTKASFMMPGGIGELQHALAYSMPLGGAALGVDPQTMVVMTALLNRLGFSGSRGGTNLIAAMSRTIPGIFGSGLLKGKSYSALSDMGFIDSSGHSKFIKNGKFDAFLWIQGLSSFVHDAIVKDPVHGRERILKDFQHAFGSQGGKIASLLSSPRAIDQLDKMVLLFQQLADMGVIQNTFYTKSVSQKWLDAKTNFQNALIELGTQLLPLATIALNHFNSAITGLTTWMQNHKRETKLFAESLVAISIALSGLGTLGLVAAAITALLTPVGAAVIAITALGAAITALVNFIPHFAHKTISPAQTEKFVNNPLKTDLNPLGDPFIAKMLSPFSVNVTVSGDIKNFVKASVTHQGQQMSRQQNIGTSRSDNTITIPFPAY